jgi:hypothetical protein
MVDREDPAANTAMFRAFAHRREADSPTEKTSVGAAVWITAAVAIVVVVGIIAWMLA